MATILIDLQVTIDDETSLKAQGFNKHPVPLSSTKTKKLVHLWFKYGCGRPITRIQFSFTTSMEKCLKDAGYTKCLTNFNTSSNADPIYMWYYTGTGESFVPITDVDWSLTDEPKKFKEGWERLAFHFKCNEGEEFAFLWMKREQTTYIKEMQITDTFDYNADLYRAGLICVDESTNRGVNGKPVFLWYLPTTQKDGSNGNPNYGALKLTPNNDEPNGFHKLTPQLNLNSDNNDYQTFLWYKPADLCQKPIQTVALMFNKDLIKTYEAVGVKVQEMNINSGEGCLCFPATPLYLAYYP